MSGPAVAQQADKPTTLQLWTAFGLLYIVWGSTYLAIRVAVSTLPPFGLAGARFVIAGGLPMLWLLGRGAPWPSLVQWRNSAVVGGCLMLGGNGLVSLAERDVSSILAALLVALTPMWFVLCEALRPGGAMPDRRTTLGLGVGFLGVAWLVGPGAMRADLGSPSLFGILLLLAAGASWAFGSLYGKYRERPASLFMTSALQMLCGGVELLLLSCALGEPAQLQHLTIGREVWFAFVYLIVFGSWLGFGSYVWLLARVSTTRLSTYAFVNPLVAVVLGAWLLHEPFSARSLGPALLILAGVAIVQLPTRAAVSGKSAGK
ncbi:MAG: hypothetical protein RL701_8167 [Pseudomonadota bacterium]